jgi:ApaG protein
VKIAGEMAMYGSHSVTEGIEITVRSEYVESQSSPEEAHYFFVYEVTIENIGERNVQLLSRHWVITDGTGEEKHVRGDGVVGEQPVLEPGEVFQYKSFCPLETPVGSMLGSYRFKRPEGAIFDAIIAPFTLALPNMLN